jgi:hypothetical protein
MTSSSLSVDISSLGYMDDANWIASSKEDLEFLLDIADEYYSLTRAAINKNKSRLLTNALCSPDPIQIKFGSSSIPIAPELGSVRFLGVWINIFNSSSFVKKQTKDTISSFIAILKSKPLTDKQLIYIFNTVLMPTLEYRLQTTPLSYNECNTLSAPFRRLLKSNSKFTSSAPYCLFKGNNFYNLHDLWNQQMQAFSTALLYQFNSKTIYNDISRIRLFRLQSNNGLHVSPLVKWNLPYNNRSSNNLIGVTLSLLKQNRLEISFDVHKSLRNEIKGGSISLDSILPQDTLIKHQYIINKFSLFFLDQFLDNDGSSLINWEELINRPCYKNNFFKKNNIPTFYKLISNLVLESDSSRLVSQNYRLAHSNIFFIDSHNLDINIDDKKYEYISALNTQFDRPIIGRIARKVRSHNNLVIQHITQSDAHDSLSSLYNERAIKKCNGCELNNDELLNSCHNPPYSWRKFWLPLPLTTCVQGYHPNLVIPISKSSKAHPIKGNIFLKTSTKDTIQSLPYMLKRKNSVRSSQQISGAPSIPHVDPHLSKNFELIKRIVSDPFQ